MSATKVPCAVRISVYFANLYLLSASGAKWVIDQCTIPTVNVNYSSGLYTPPIAWNGHPYCFGPPNPCAGEFIRPRKVPSSK